VDYVSIIAPEIWVLIFQYLTPVDLCFSISPVNKLFRELSQDNQIWSLFKCNSWNEKSVLLPTIKRKFPVIENSTVALYKKLYINWIREQVHQTNILNIKPNWITVNGKQSITIGVISDSYLPYNSKKPELSDNKYYFLKSKYSFKTNNSESSYYRDTQNEISNYFPGQQVEATLQDFTIIHSRFGVVRAIAAKINSNRIGGIFWCINKFYPNGSKIYIESVKSRLDEVAPNAHLMVVDCTPISGTAKPPEKFKTWVRELGADFVEFADIDNALPKMATTITLKYNNSVPKYLPTATEFTKHIGPLPGSNELNRLM